ncbi:hypothetical protein [Enterococcus alishanensis]
MKFLEINGSVKGIVVSENDKTLLIRKGYLAWSGETQVFLATEKAVYVEKQMFDQYWIKLFEGSYVVETINIDLSTVLIREFFNM